jgi:hypothetical protein
MVGFPMPPVKNLGRMIFQQPFLETTGTSLFLSRVSYKSREYFLLRSFVLHPHGLSIRQLVATTINKILS